MVTGTYSCDKDRIKVDDARNYLTWLICGKRNTDICNKFKNRLSTYIKRIDVLPYGKRDNDINENAPGVCYSSADGTSTIKMYGYKNAFNYMNKFITHEFIHEHVHSICNLMPELIKGNNKYKNVLASNGKVYSEFPIAGQIGYYYSDNYDSRNDEYYTFGTMFAETFADMFTTMALIAYEPTFDKRGVSVDSVLREHVNDWKDAKTGYSVFTSLTRLMFAAFSNCSEDPYQILVDNGCSIVNMNCKTGTGKTLKVNDFMYGMIYDPIYIEEKYDFFMGKGAYIALCARMDGLFKRVMNSGTFTSRDIQDIKHFMNVIPDFCNKKKKYYLSNGLITSEEAGKMVGNFNKVWNSMQTEYQSFFSQNDINEIYRRAGQNTPVYIGGYPTIPPVCYSGNNNGNSHVLVLK